MRLAGSENSRPWTSFLGDFCLPTDVLCVVARGYNRLGASTGKFVQTPLPMGWMHILRSVIKGPLWGFGPAITPSFTWGSKTGGMYHRSSSRRDVTKRLRLRTSNGLTLDVNWAHETVGELQEKAAELSLLKVDSDGATGATGAIDGSEDHDSEVGDDQRVGESMAEYVSRLKAALKSVRK